MSDPKLNLGSGMMLMAMYINFDCIQLSNEGRSTDIIGSAEDLMEIFKPETFNLIFCSHVIEHLYPEQGHKLIADCYTLLRTGGQLSLEGPDVAKIAQLYPALDEQLIAELYGRPEILKQYGPDWMHKWGWTQYTATAAVREAGFENVVSGEGHSHSQPKRDYAVTGFKP